MRRVVPFLIAVALAAACSAGSDVAATTTTAPAAPPEQVVAGWIEAVAAGDPAATTGLVDDVSLAIMIGAENPVAVSDLAAMLENGVGATARATYWETFRSDFVTFAGVAIGDLQVGTAEEFTAGDTRFAAVPVTGGERLSEILCRRGGDGRWQVDLVATVGPQLVRALRTLVVTLPPGEEGDAVRGAFFARVGDSLRAGAERAPGDDLPDAFRVELEALVGYLDSAN